MSLFVGPLTRSPAPYLAALSHLAPHVGGRVLAGFVTPPARWDDGRALELFEWRRLEWSRVTDA